MDSERVTVRATKAGREQPLADLYRTRWPSMVRLATLLTGSQQRAEDLVQDVFVRLHRRGDLGDTPTAYLRAAVVNACRSDARSRMRDRRPWTAGQPSWSRETVEWVDLLALLPARARAAIVLRYWLDLTDQQIADTLGCRPATVRSLLRRGLARLRPMLERAHHV
jgi:DNA-directed RNA polymerase specialized sigma24 family protein